MTAELLERLRCPTTLQRLVWEQDLAAGEAVAAGWLVSEDGRYRYRVRDGIARFVPETNYADNFGIQWNHFRQTQLDSYSGQPISANRFWKATGWTPEDLRDQWVLDVGCGAGRFAEVVLNAGAHVVAVDYSSAVDACYANLTHHPNLHVLQGDIYSLPLKPGSFHFVYSLGVLQHTPDVAKAFTALTQMLAPEGRICVDYYWRRVRTMLHAKYVFRPLTRRMRPDRVFQILQRWVPGLLRTSQLLAKVPVIGRGLQRAVPVADYTGLYPLTDEQLREWALLDTFDMLCPAYDHPQSSATIRRWCEVAGLTDVEVLHAGHLVARGRQPA
ncbi:MAG: tRNA (mo5U34)-methyltransferase [Nitrospira sp.]|nr:tRNA (mo5U34)-methyltransferase [Nitrospira sp.]